MTPVDEIDRPGGRPVAVKPSVLVVSGSENEPDTSRLTTSLSLLDTAPRATLTGASLTPVTVMVTVAVEVAPDGSEMV